MLIVLFLRARDRHALRDLDSFASFEKEKNFKTKAYRRDAENAEKARRKWTLAAGCRRYERVDMLHLHV